MRHMNVLLPTALVVFALVACSGDTATNTESQEDTQTADSTDVAADLGESDASEDAVGADEAEDDVPEADSDDTEADEEPEVVLPRPPCFYDGRVANIAHRGGLRFAPEHTLVAFQNALDVGADVLELDLHATQDGVVVVLHDDTVEGTTEGEGLVKRMTLEELKELDAGYDYRVGGEYPYRGQGLTIPTLAEVLEAFPEECYTVEIKQTEPWIVDEVLAVFDEYGAAENAIFASFDDRVADAIRDDRPELMTGMGAAAMALFFSATDSQAEGYETPSQAAQAPWEYLDAPLVERAHNADLLVHPWTVNGEQNMRDLIEMGVDGIITDDPELLNEVLGR